MATHFHDPALSPYSPIESLMNPLSFVWEWLASFRSEGVQDEQVTPDSKSENAAVLCKEDMM
ncbi:uncharacterized protein AKAW2_80462S [Aspergillus luchuensis]|uniref:Alcohol dehydrogenase n=1 Tax=Aspergillus kawachii TaxID=1069201 RepID=A0A146F9U7_ASPKA|nr:uncharacterized protein AKAW2_80462S [Aspergillus luchuensis]BCS04661.1 hypothetical protein AKAW2_80462S [Aspergillus luchuensis]BCS16233.1 hypothetical protein ALUC_80440S [Aspergillus luchuensis]GAT22479.1 alcohol dehydrogenase [Aspergillus luchuensis]